MDIFNALRRQIRRLGPEGYGVQSEIAESAFVTWLVEQGIPLQDFEHTHTSGGTKVVNSKANRPGGPEALYASFRTFLVKTAAGCAGRQLLVSKPALSKWVMARMRLRDKRSVQGVIERLTADGLVSFDDFGVAAILAPPEPRPPPQPSEIG